MKFKEWFDTKLVVGGYLYPEEIMKSDYKYIINVSDEYIKQCHDVAIVEKKHYYWFPINEISGDMGINSIYAALQILSIAEKESAKVYLHCHAGANRSPTVADAYFFMRTSKHRGRRKIKMSLYENFELMGIEQHQCINNRMLNNIESGNLPAILRLESFLIHCSKVFESEGGGGMIDYCKEKSRI